ncbi:MAG: M23 family metallopeptidase [Pseudomonadota bacterium]
MNIILFSKSRGSSKQVDLLTPSVLSLAALVVAGVLAVAFAGGFLYASNTLHVDPDVRIVELEAQVRQQADELELTRRDASENLAALAVRIGQMQSHVIRLDALGRRLTQMANMEDGEFDFDSAPAQGGPESSSVVEPVKLQAPEIMDVLDRLDGTIEDREQQLAVLENLLQSRRLHDEVHPGGRPILSGWMSSYYGTRIDPFTGNKARHEGIDFAGKAGAKIISVAAGVVTYSGDRHGYGNMIEINHGNGLSTRYAHNQANLVAVGDKVEKGQVVALMGSTGRATGPNLHFEVRKNGRTVDPLKFVRDAG